LVVQVNCLAFVRFRTLDDATSDVGAVAMSNTQNVTIRLSHETLRKATAIAARPRRRTSLSALLAEQHDALVVDEAMGQALAMLEAGFHLGGRIQARRDELHER
jgi:hypothetical protein